MLHPAGGNFWVSDGREVNTASGAADDAECTGRTPGPPLRTLLSV